MKIRRDPRSVHGSYRSSLGVCRVESSKAGTRTQRATRSKTRSTPLDAGVKPMHVSVSAFDGAVIPTHPVFRWPLSSFHRRHIWQPCAGKHGRGRATSPRLPEVALRLTCSLGDVSRRAPGCRWLNRELAAERWPARCDFHRRCSRFPVEEQGRKHSRMRDQLLRELQVCVQAFRHPTMRCICTETLLQGNMLGVSLLLYVSWLTLRFGCTGAMSRIPQPPTLSEGSGCVCSPRRRPGRQPRSAAGAVAVG